MGNIQEVTIGDSHRKPILMMIPSGTQEGAIGLQAMLLYDVLKTYFLIDAVRYRDMIIPSNELFRNYDSAILNLGATLLGIFYFGLFGSALIGIREFYPESNGLYINGGYLIISIFATIWICDSAAFFGGTALGKHRLFLRVSPKKSWEGAIFGFVFAILTMISAKYLVLDFLSLKDVIIIGL